MSKVKERKAAKEMSEATKKKITEFLYENREMLVIVADPETDVVVTAYRDQMEANRLVDSSTGKPGGIVSDVVQYNRETEAGKTSISSFLQLIDGQVHDLSKRLQGEGNEQKQKVEK